jgi:hypothetical protein
MLGGMADDTGAPGYMERGIGGGGPGLVGSATAKSRSSPHDADGGAAMLTGGSGLDVVGLMLTGSNACGCRSGCAGCPTNE